MSRTLHTYAAAAIVLLCFPADADTLLLRSGLSLQGRIISEDPETVVIEVAHGVVRVPASDVVSVDRTDEPQDLLDSALEFSRADRADLGLRKLAQAARAGAHADAVRDVRVMILRAEAARLEGRLRLAEAYAVVQRARAIVPEDTDLARASERIEARLGRLRDLVDVARVAAGHGELRKAADLFEQSFLVAPETRSLLAREYADVCQDLGDRALSESDPRAAAWFDKALAAEPSRAAQLQSRCVHSRLLPVLDLLKHDRVTLALRAMPDVVAFAPNDPQVRYVYGRILESCGAADEARAQYEAALSSGEHEAGRGDVQLESLRRRVESALKRVHSDADGLRRAKRARAEVEPGPAKRAVGRHFVVHHRNAALAGDLLRVADRQAERIMALCEGETVPWDSPCPIYLLPDEASFLEATGQPVWSGGLSHTESVGGNLTRQYLTVYQTSSRLLASTVPHEVAHLVFSALTRYAEDVPIALHEGFAVLHEPRGMSERDRALLVWKRLSGELHPLDSLLSMRRIELDPELFYAQSASVVAFLIGRGDGLPCFVRFAKELARNGVGPALRACYGLDGVAQLERAWRASLGVPGSRGE